MYICICRSTLNSSISCRSLLMDDHLDDDDQIETQPIEKQIPSSSSNSRKTRRNKTEKAIEQCQEAKDRYTEAIKEQGQRRDEIQLAIVEEQKRMVALQTEYLANRRAYQEEIIKLRKEKLQEIKEIKIILIQINNRKHYHCFIPFHHF